MKKMLLMMFAVLLVAACEKPVLGEVEDESEISETGGVKSSKKFTFTVKGDFGTPTFSRGYLQADGKDMTDLWVFDFMDGECVQTLHQSGTDEDFGRPVMSLAYGAHHVYFVASRGTSPSVDAASKTISWTRPSDTFWKDYEVSVVSTSNGNRAVTLDRVVTKLRVTVNDEVPATMSTMAVTPAIWYYGLNYQTGEPSGVSNNQERVISVPSSYIGTGGQLSMSIFGISGTSEWTTDVIVAAKNSGGDVIGSATITAAPFKANRATEYSGNLFGSIGTLDLSLGAEWDDSETGTW